MKYLLILASFVFVSALIAAPIPVTHPPHNNHNNTTVTNNTTIVINHNHPHFKQIGIVKHKWGYGYKGFAWNHWAKHQWSVKHNTYCYFNPHVGGWYYWCQPDGCWYPITYCPYGVYNWEDSPDLDPQE